MSDYDSNEDMTGFVGVTHKATEGTKYTHVHYGPRLNKYKSQGIQVLGSYHVVRTPGNGGNGSLSSQLDFWLSTMDKATPWWRTYPHFILQIDLEQWPYDQVSAATGMQFAKLLVDSGVPGWKITYASRGQYGNSLSGIATPLWNAAYRSSSYPGDSSPDWAQYSGKTPVLLQYTSTPFDKNSFRGSLDDLLALFGGNAVDPNLLKVLFFWMDILMQNWNPTRDEWVKAGGDPALYDLATSFGNSRNGIQVALDSLETSIANLTAKVTAGMPISIDDTTRQALVNSVVTALQTLNVGLSADALAKVEQAVHAELAKVQITVGA